MAASRGRSALIAGAVILALVATAAITGVVRGWHRPRAGFVGGTVNPARAPTPPVHGAYFGARVRPPIYTEPAEIAAVDRLQGQIGRRLDIVHVYHLWRDPFPNSSDLAFLRQGSMLLLSWSGTDTRTIAAGKYDSLIRKRALAIKAAGKRIFLEWRWEMDRPGLRAQIHSPAAYIAAWDHIRSIFAAEHVDNVAWVWCPTARGFATGTAAAYYPGDNEVNWVCADAYPGPGPYRSFATIVQPFLDWASHRPKPIMIGEYGAPDTYGPLRRARWLWGAARTVQDNRQIKALVYFDANAKHAYALGAGSPALRAFRGIAHIPYFNPVNPSEP
jgi:hypothetical protein